MPKSFSKFEKENVDSNAENIESPKKRLQKLGTVILADQKSGLGSSKLNLDFNPMKKKKL